MDRPQLPLGPVEERIVIDDESGKEYILYEQLTGTNERFRCRYDSVVWTGSLVCWFCGEEGEPVVRTLSLRK